MATPEIEAWTRARNWMQYVYGFGLAVWAANYFTDNEGGNMHELYWRVNQFFSVMPLLQLYLTWNIVTSYSTNAWDEEENISDYEANAGTSKHGRDHLFRRFQTEQYIADTDDSTFVERQLSNQWGMVFASVAFAMVQRECYPHIAQAFHDDKTLADELAAAEESASE